MLPLFQPLWSLLHWLCWSQDRDLIRGGKIEDQRGTSLPIKAENYFSWTYLKCSLGFLNQSSTYQVGDTLVPVFQRNDCGLSCVCCCAVFLWTPSVKSEKRHQFILCQSVCGVGVVWSLPRTPKRLHISPIWTYIANLSIFLPACLSLFQNPRRCCCFSLRYA